MADPDTRLVDLFQAALDFPPDEREWWLRSHCDDETLRAELRELLAEHAAAGEDLDAPAAALRGIAEELWVAPLPVGQRLAGFTLERVLASGGMGTVYEARQDTPERRVAVKLLARGLEGGARRRLEYESKVLAHLHHPGIAQVYECGTVERDGQAIPWFAMEFVEGARSITGYARTEPLDDRLRLFVEACAAVHYGHQKGIIHRDLKPANILVDAGGRVKVIDFGVAKSTDSEVHTATLLTHAGQLVGTLGYMSPEQTTGNSADLDTRTDVYSLGVVLYELLTGQLPHDIRGKSIVASVRVLAEEEPDRAALSRAGIHEDLRTVVLKALARDREQRYDSAAAFADDVLRFVRCEPIAARPPSAIYHLSRFARRNRLLVATAAALLAALVVGGIGTLRGYFEAARSAATATRALETAEWGRGFLARMLYEADPWHGRGPEVTLGKALQRASFTLEQNLPEPAVEADMRAILGEVLLRLGDAKACERHLRLAVDYRRGHGLADDYKTLQLEIGLINALLGMRRIEDAHALATRAAAAHTRTFEARPAARLRLDNALGQVLMAKGDSAQAKRVMAAALGHPGAQAATPKFLATLKNNLALAMHRLGEGAAAVTLLRDVVATREEILPTNHPDLFGARANLASALYGTGDYDGAIPLFERALAGQRALLGSTHPKTLSTMANLGAALRNAGHNPRAIELAREAYDLRRARYGEQHPETLLSMSNLGIATMALGVDDPAIRATQFDKAHTILSRCLALHVEAEEQPSRQRAKVLGNLANLMLVRGHSEAARDLYARAAAIFERHRLTRRWEYFWFKAAAAHASTAVGATTDAFRVLERCHAALRKLRGESARTTRRVHEWLVDIHRAPYLGRAGRRLTDR